MTGYQTDVGIPYKQVLDPVLREVGINPAHSPWPLTGSKPLGLYRIIGWAFRNQRSDIRTSRYCGKRHPKCTDLGRGIWGLTPSGVEHSLSLKESTFPRLLGDPHPELNEEVDPEVVIPEQEPEGDTRDDLTWVVLELSRAGEIRVEEGTLEDTLRRDLQVDAEFPMFIPAVSYARGDRVVTLQLMEGYAFVGAGLDEVSYFKLEQRGYVNQVMSAMGPSRIRALHVIPNRSVEDMRRKLRSMTMLDVSPGDQVKVVEGKYRGLSMEVLDVEDEFVSLHTVGMRSLHVITRLPKMFLSLERATEEEE